MTSGQRSGTPRGLPSALCTAGIGSLVVLACFLISHGDHSGTRHGRQKPRAPSPRSTGAELVALGTRIKMKIRIPILSLPLSFSVIFLGTSSPPRSAHAPGDQGLRGSGTVERGLHVPPRKRWLSCWATARTTLHFCSASGLLEPQAS